MKIAGRRPAEALRQGVRWGNEKVPVGVRSVLGVLLFIGGLFAFLPILGVWMIPLGGALIALDIPPLRRRLLDWANRGEERESAK